MSGKMNKGAYVKLIAEDLAWLKAVLAYVELHGPSVIVSAGHMTVGSLEHRHIEDVLKRSIETEYRENE